MHEPPPSSSLTPSSRRARHQPPLGGAAGRGPTCWSAKPTCTRGPEVAVAGGMWKDASGEGPTEGPGCRGDYARGPRASQRHHYTAAQCQESPSRVCFPARPGQKRRQQQTYRGHPPAVLAPQRGSLRPEDQATRYVCSGTPGHHPSPAQPTWHQVTRGSRPSFESTLEVFVQ